MNEESDEEAPNCGNSECSGDGQRGQDREQDHPYQEYSDYEPLQYSVKEPDPAESTKLVKNKPRSVSVDSESSDITRRPNFKCGSCKKSFLLDRNQKMIRCSFCGYRILFKLRTRTNVTYKTE